MTQKDLAARSGVSQQLISQLETGSITATNKLPALAKALGAQVSEIDPRFTDTSAGDVGGDSIDFIPIVSWESIPHLSESGIPKDVALFPTLPTVGLPPGALVALRVSGMDMQRVSPPDSIIIANLDDTRLISGRYYVIECADTGDVLYRRLAPGTGIPLFMDAPCSDGRTARGAGKPVRANRIFGRVYRTLCDL